MSDIRLAIDLNNKVVAIGFDHFCILYKIEALVNLSMNVSASSLSKEERYLKKKSDANLSKNFQKCYIFR